MDASFSLSCRVADPKAPHSGQVGYEYLHRSILFNPASTFSKCFSCHLLRKFRVHRGSVNGELDGFK
ncbi:hypothetical protein DSO57_1010204 [Entomophthora muscae]|uniref:Uncharacterized protein n=1 Tax=Entomophthora muscae TaxID=34485 RepID=A0ACC2RL94_9FUNG|nr:hypothetical protein DSO57_1010204 [Entomophthora muscae]